MGMMGQSEMAFRSTMLTDLSTRLVIELAVEFFLQKERYSLPKMGCGLVSVRPIISSHPSGRLWFAIGVAFHNVRGQIYPTVGLAQSGARVRARFGLPMPDGVMQECY